MNRRLAPLSKPVTLDFEGQEISAREGEPVAVSLLASDERLFARSVKYHRARGPYCLSGGCGQCLLRIDGVPNMQSCRVPAKAGMRLERQNAFPDADADLFAAADLVFPKWFNHHEFLAGVPLAHGVMLAIARQLSGLGKLPDKVGPEAPPAVVEHVPVAIVGAGAAGLEAAQVLTEREVPYVLFEREPVVGGRLLLEGTGRASFVPPARSVRTSATVVGLFHDTGPCLAVVKDGKLMQVFFEKVLLANGGQPLVPPCENNDLPGIHSGRAVARLLRRYAVLPAERIAVVGEAVEAKALAALIGAAGGEAVAVGATPKKAHGHLAVTSLTVEQNGREEKVDCGAVAVCGPLAPSSELAQAAGAQVSWNDTHRLFTVEADEHGRTAQPHVFVAGELLGPVDVLEAARQGARAAEAIASEARP